MAKSSEKELVEAFHSILAKFGQFSCCLGDFSSKTSYFDVFRNLALILPVDSVIGACRGPVSSFYNPS